MTRLRFTLAQLMALVISLGFGLAALRNADPFWASATYSLAIILIAAAPVAAFARRGTARMAWAGFAVFGWTYLLVAQIPPWPIGGLGSGPIPKPVLLIEWGIVRLQSQVNPQSMRTSSWVQFEQVSLSLGIVLFGLVGAVVSRVLAVRDERPA
jgi:hypothetical protein